MSSKLYVFMAFFLLTADYAAAGFVPAMVAGHVYDAVSGRPINGVNLTLSGNQSGFLWSGISKYNPFNDYPDKRDGEYSTGHTLSLVVGELLTVTITNVEEIGYNGTGQVVVPPDEDLIDYLDVYAQDVQNPRYLSAGFRQSELGDVVLYSGWEDNSNATLSVWVTHNATGVFGEYACVKSGGEYVYTVSKGNLVRGKRVAYSFTAVDPSSNINASMPSHEFTYEPLTIQYTVNMVIGWNLIAIPIIL